MAIATVVAGPILSVILVLAMFGVGRPFDSEIESGPRFMYAVVAGILFGSSFWISAGWFEPRPVARIFRIIAVVLTFLPLALIPIALQLQG